MLKKLPKIKSKKVLGYGMKLFHGLVFALAIFIAIPAHADISSLFNPFAWFRAIKRTYYWKTDSKRMVALNAKLKKLYHARIELETLKKIYWGNARIMRDLSDKESWQALQRDVETLNNQFEAKQQEWGNARGCYLVTAIDNFERDLFIPEVAKTEEETCAVSNPLPPSWYTQLKKTERSLPFEEHVKPHQEREQEFKKWQKKQRLHELYKARIELETLTKIYKVNAKMEAQKPQDPELASVIQKDKDTLAMAFNTFQMIHAGITLYPLRGIEWFTSRSLEPSIKRMEQENNVPAVSLAPSWYEQLKAQAKTLNSKAK